MVSPASRSQALSSPLLQGDDEVVCTRNSSDFSASVSATASNLSLTTASTANSVPTISGTESTVLESTIANACNMPRHLVDHGPDHKLRLVGLNQHMRAQWLRYLVQVMFNHSPGHGPQRRRFLSYTQSPDGCSLVAEEQDLGIFPESALCYAWDMRGRLQCIQIVHQDYGIDRYGVGWHMAQQLLRGSINMLYLSTANSVHVLVDGKDVNTALGLLDEEHEAKTTA
ncbi:hypothetical protein HK405_014177 [Cladochytrium tenue]|nr:hypothetical protein HK405_014177 [Cladochytrium tenue]